MKQCAYPQKNMTQVSAFSSFVVIHKKEGMGHEFFFFQKHYMIKETKKVTQVQRNRSGSDHKL